MANIYKNLDKIFKLVDVDYNQVIIEVNANTPLLVAQYPFVTSEMKYITVTRGKNHVLTIVFNKGTTDSFSWGDRGHTIISDSTAILKVNVLSFLDDKGIILDYNGKEFTGRPIKIYFNPNYKRWQLTFEGLFIWWSNKATNITEMIEECKKFVIAEKWNLNPKWSKSDMDIWTAVNPVIKLK